MYITLYIKKDCPYSHSAHIALGEKKMSFKVVELDEEVDHEQILSMNPDGILPILKERDYVICDPEVVLLYIDERYPSPSLLPNYSVERARIRLAMTRINRELYSMLDIIVDEQNEEKIAEAKKTLMDSFHQIQPVFSENDFFISDTMTLADCLFAALIHALPRYDIILDDSFAELNAYAKRMFERDSFVKTLPKKVKKIYRRQ